MNKDVVVVARSQICHFEQINLHCSLLSVSFAAESSQQLREKQFYGISMKYSRASRGKKSWRSFEVSQDDGVGARNDWTFQRIAWGFCDFAPSSLFTINRITSPLFWLGEAFEKFNNKIQLQPRNNERNEKFFFAHHARNGWLKSNRKCLAIKSTIKIPKR